MQAADCNGSPNISVSLLKEILMEREAKIDELRKEIRRVQSENVHIVEEKQQLLLENEHLRTQAETTIIKKERNGQNFMDSFDPNSPVVLQRQIRNLKSQISDLQEANESAVMELTKADEEISQQRKDLAMLKAEYSQKLHDSQEQINILMEQMNLPSSGLIQPDNYQEEVIQLRGECRRLRMQGHQLSEENYRLKEDLWDLRMQKEGLLSKTKDELHYSWTPKSEWSSSGDKNLQCGSWCSEQNRREMFNGVFPKHKAVSGPEVLKEPWERKHEALYRRSASPYSADSENTEVLVLGYHEDELHKPYHTYTNGSEHEEILELRKEDLCTVSPIKENIISNSEQNGINSLIYGSSRKSPTCMRKQVSVLPRRPFAPKSIADLKHGDLVKFIRPGGKISKGTIQYKGHLPGREEAYLGIELEGGEFGKHDGVFQGTRYFLCKPNKGVFVNFSKVIMAWS
ncbi:golgin subfamily A member 6-like protein 7 isoform X3 [Hyperolius riggenbachi]|uniref:golgin subfamily A member 6-like protein 7 isoform X3 n=1 Tax=Hyperolius riggenbachi TaxID=752182 RepID=UPI0035A3C444